VLLFAIWCDAKEGPLLNIIENREGTRNATHSNFTVHSNQKMNMASLWVSVFYCTAKSGNTVTADALK
jgi:hypothetical protein